MIALVSLIIAVTGAAAFWLLLKSRHMEIWFWSYIKDLRRRRQVLPARTRHIYFCFVDHYEPYWNKVDRSQAHRRVAKWVTEYPQVAQRHRDSDGRTPQHTYFYPEEEYDAEILQQLADLCRLGYGDIEVHLHHDNDTAPHLRQTLTDFKEKLARDHGLLRRDARGELIYAFIHGNWALDNSRPDGRWCGVDNELAVLKETGCYADFTMPSAPSDTQTKKINSIYFAHGRPGHCKSHDEGVDVRVGSWDDAGLLMVQGPLTLNWRQRKLGLIPKIESGELSFDAPPNAERVRLWGTCAVSVRGAEDHVFIKVHTHGATEKSSEMLFDRGGFERLWSELERQYRDTPGYALHYVSAWEAYCKIKSLAGAAV